MLAANRLAAGAAEQRHLFGLAAQGVHSPLELWGHERVFTDGRLPSSRWQVPVTLPSGRVRDLRRDAALAALGYLTVRFSHLRLHADPAGVKEELLVILATRRAQLRGVA